MRAHEPGEAAGADRPERTEEPETAYCGWCVKEVPVHVKTAPDPDPNHRGVFTTVSCGYCNRTLSQTQEGPGAEGEEEGEGRSGRTRRK